MWIEKYRPKELKDIIGNQTIIKTLKGYVKAKEMPHLLFYGKPGCGKTTAALCLVNELLGEDKAINSFILNTSDDRKMEVIRGPVKSFLGLKKIGDVPFKIIILDECDNMRTDAQNALRAMFEHKMAENTRFILTCNSIHKVIPAIQSRCYTKEFTFPNNVEITGRLEHILKNEGHEDFITEINLGELIEQVGDLRQIITILETRVTTGVEIQDLIRMPLDLGYSVFEDVKNGRLRNAILKIENAEAGSLVDSLHEICKMKIESKDGLIKALKVLGETDFRLSMGTNPNIQLNWMIAKLIESEV